MLRTVAPLEESESTVTATGAAGTHRQTDRHALKTASRFKINDSRKFRYSFYLLRTVLRKID
jgi:hypothetical protein